MGLRLKFFCILFFAIFQSLARADISSIDPTFGMGRAVTSLPRNPEPDWIWDNDEHHKQILLFRKKFSVTTLSKDIFLFITAEKTFEVYVNGHKLRRSKGPVEDEWKEVEFFHIGKYLRVGENIIAVRVRSLGKGGLLARIENNKEKISWTDSTWKFRKQHLFTGPWTELNYDDSKWALAEEIGPASTATFPDNTEFGLNGWPNYNPEVPEYLSHLSLPSKAIIETHENGGLTDPAYIVLDFGKEISGRIVLKSRHLSLALVTTGESLDELQSPLRTYRVFSTAQSSSGTDYTAFRYAKILFPNGQGLPGQSDYQEISADHDYYPVEYKGSFDSSDPLLNQIWYTGAYTAHLCMQTEIWDAPKRDRVAWMGDLHVSGEVINIVFADQFLMKKTLHKLLVDAEKAKLLNHVNSIAGYSCAWISALADYYRHSGDFQFLENHKTDLKWLLSYLHKDLDGRGVFANIHGGSNFVDWSPGLSKDSPDGRRATHFFLLKAVQDAAFIFHELSDENEARANWQWAKELKEAAQKYLLDSNTDTFGDRRQVNAMAILSGAPTEIQRKDIYEKILQPLSPSWNQMASPYYNYYVIEALARLQKSDVALDIIRDYWGGMLKLGATTFWEAYDPSWPKNEFHKHLKADDGEGTFVSLSHGWSAGPTVWLTEHVLGVKPLSGGYKEILITPHLGDLSWAAGDIPTPQGILHIKIKKIVSGLSVQLFLPPQVSARIIIPGLEMDNLNRSGHYLIESP